MTIGASLVSSIVSMCVRRRGTSRQFCVTYPWTLHTEQIGDRHGSFVTLVTLPPVLFGGGGAEVETRLVFGGVRGGCDIVSIGWMGFNAT